MPTIPTPSLPDSQLIEFNLIYITYNGLNSTININLPILAIIFTTIFLLILAIRGLGSKLKSYNTDEITIKEPFTGTRVKIKANSEDRKIAHRIWTELVTRKAALPFQRDKDVIIEVYDSWHTLFKCTREQIAAIPIEKLNGREKLDIEKLIDVSTKVLNEGLRPHLTEWQAKYRVWYEAAKANCEDKSISPQDLQRTYPHYEQLVSDIENVNNKLQIFAEELKKIVRGIQ